MIRQIDLFRAFLCQYVILAHLIPAIYPGVLGVPGTLAVWCFFVLSGYLNFFSFRDSRNMGEYYFKRCSRLYPLLIFSFLIVCLLEKTLFVNDVYTLFPWLLGIKETMPHNGVLWTLIVELQLYLITPLLFYGMQKIKIRIGFLPVVIATMAFLSLVLSFVASKLIYGYTDLDDRTVFSAIPLYLFGFFLAQGNFHSFDVKSIWRNGYFWLSLLLFVLVVLSRNGMADWRAVILPWESLFLEGRLIPLLASALIILCPFTFFSKPGLFDAIGKATYEIYILHGLSVYIFYKLQPDGHNFVEILGYFWFLPTLAGIAVHFLVSKKLNRLAKSLLLRARSDDVKVSEI